MRAKDLTRQWPAELSDSRAIAEYIDSNSSSFIDIERIEDEYRGCRAVLKIVNLAQLSQGHPDGNIKQSSKQTRFDKMKIENQPPIVIDGDVVIDGNHRLRSATRAKKSTIKAYVII